MPPALASDGYEWALIHVFPIKDATARHKKVPPIPLRRRQRGGACRGADPLCTYDALHIHGSRNAPATSPRSNASSERRAARRCSWEPTAGHPGRRWTRGGW
eukprot:6174976-Pleurochrysis_carterae.AAC.2